MSARQMQPECRLDEHVLCRTGPVVTCYGDVALTIHCACPCHARRETARKESQ